MRGTRNAELLAAASKRLPAGPTAAADNLRALSWQSLLAAGTQQGAICTDTGRTSRGGCPEVEED